MTTLTSDEITVVSGGSLQTIDVIASRLGWKPLSTKQAEALIEQHAAAAAATIPIMVAFVVGLATNYAYESMGGKEGIDKALEDFEKCYRNNGVRRRKVCVENTGCCWYR
jgi:hypothetical protein